MATRNTAPRADLLEREPSELHENFAAYIKTETGYKDVDVKSVQLATVLRMDFQRSDTNQEHLAKRRAAKEAREAAKAAKPAKAQAKKAPAKKAPARDEVGARRAAKAPAKPAKRAAAGKEPPF